MTNFRMDSGQIDDPPDLPQLFQVLWVIFVGLKMLQTGQYHKLVFTFRRASSFQQSARKALPGSRKSEEY